MCSVHELCSDWHAPYTQWPLLPTPSAGEIRCSLLIASLHHCMLQRQSMYATNDVRKASVHYNQLWSITEPIPNRPRLHRDAPLVFPQNIKSAWRPCFSLGRPYISSFFLLQPHSSQFKRPVRQGHSMLWATRNTQFERYRTKPKYIRVWTDSFQTLPAPHPNHKWENSSVRQNDPYVFFSFASGLRSKA